MYIQALRLQGDHYDMGNEQGARFAKPIRKLVQTRQQALQSRCSNKEMTPETWREIARRVWDAHEQYDARLIRELLGIADGADMDPLDLLLAIGHNDIGDLVTCQASHASSIACWLDPQTTRQQVPLVGYSLACPIQEGYPLMALHHVPEQGPETLLLTAHSGLGVAGINQAGIVALLNQVHVADATPGVIAAFLLRHALQHGSLESVAKALIAAPRMAGCSILVADAWGRALNLELSAQNASITLLQSKSFVHTNHFHSRKLEPEIAPSAPDSLSHQRQRRLEDLLVIGAQPSESLSDVALLQALLGDHQPSAMPICIHDEMELGVHTCGSTIISPSERTMLVAAGPACQAEHITLTLPPIQ